jgi:DNA-binding NtrC family response regulator
LLRALQSGEVRRVGSTQTRRVNVRVIGASNADLRAMAERGGFRPDLFYRLSVLTIDLPPLRERGGDVELLTQFFLRRLGDESQPLRLSADAQSALYAHSFPGNVRELENALTRAAALSTNGLITLDCLPPHIAGIRETGSGSTDEAKLNSPANQPANLAPDWPTMEELERRYLALALERVRGNRQHAADLLGLSRRTVQRLIARYHLEASAEDETIEPGADGARPDGDEEEEA